MTRINLHRPRLPSEEKVWEVKVSEVGNVGSIYFAEYEEDAYRLVEWEIDVGWDIEDYILDAAKSLIREKGAKEVYDKQRNLIAEMSVGAEYRYYQE